jgi:hypothetical protein
MIETTPHKLTSDFKEIADSSTDSIVTLQSQTGHLIEVVIDHRTQAAREASAESVVAEFSAVYHLHPGKERTFDISLGAIITAKMHITGNTGRLVVVK